MIEKNYNPTQVESRWYKFWTEKGYFKADETSEKPPFCIVIPPPNVTGKLHMGHALFVTIQDLLTRYKRMQGFEALWLPGTDHAGIATQVMVERQLAKEGKTRLELGREAFLERVWAWKREKGSNIIEQLKILGASCDWDRERFTMDEGSCRAVAEVFVRLFEEGLIYRDERLVNWDPIAQTVLSDLETVISGKSAIKSAIAMNRLSLRHRAPKRFSATRRLRCTPTTSVIDTSSANTSNYRFAVERSPS